MNIEDKELQKLVQNNDVAGTREYLEKLMLDEAVDSVKLNHAYLAAKDALPSLVEKDDPDTKWNDDVSSWTKSYFDEQISLLKDDFTDGRWRFLRFVRQHLIEKGEW